MSKATDRADRWIEEIDREHNARPAPSPRPPASCACGPDHPAPDCDIRTHREQGRRERDEGDTTGRELRDGNAVAVEDVRAIAEMLGLGGHARPYSGHDVVQREILPALRDLLAERDTLAAKVQAVEGLMTEWERFGSRYTLTAGLASEELRRALGTPTTGGGE